MSESTLNFLINGNRNMDIREGAHGSFLDQQPLLFGAHTNTVLSDYGEMLFQGIPTRFGSIWLSQYRMAHAATLSAEANVASLEVMHLLKGNIGFHPEGLAKQLDMKTCTWQMLYMPYVANRVTFPAGTNLQTLDFHFHPAWLEQLATYYPLLEKLLTATAHQVAATITPQANPITLHNNSLINALFRSAASERNQSLFLDRYLTDWIATALDELHPAPVIRSLLTDAETQRIREVINYMEENLSLPLHIAGLCRLALMNEFKFKAGFKMIAGLPFYQWLIRKRMEKAKKLLDEKRMSVADVAYACGYETPGAFTRAFKKIFGLMPSQYRR